MGLTVRVKASPGDLGEVLDLETLELVGSTVVEADFNLLLSDEEEARALLVWLGDELGEEGLSKLLVRLIESNLLFKRVIWGAGQLVQLAALPPR